MKQIEKNENLETATSTNTPRICGIFRKTLRIFWKIIQIIWYWFERIFLVIFLLILSIWLAWWLSQKPSLLRDWEPQDAITPQITWSGDIVHINNIRNHSWKTDTEFTPNYLSGSYNIRDIENVYYIITPFSDKDGPAHTMLSFWFRDWRHLVVSAEIRKERWESFGAIRGILNQYEIQYVIATEEDVIKLRTNYRKNQVIMYPINTPKEKIEWVFRSMLIRTDKLSREPEFYNTLWNNCTTTILAHTNAFRQDKIWWNLYTVLPSHSDETVYKAWLINTKLPLEEARVYYNISSIANTIHDSGNFSQIIRKPIQ